MKPKIQKYRRGYIEYLTAKELAKKLKVTTRWVKAQTRRSQDPIPVLKILKTGPVVRILKTGYENEYAWGSAKLTDWLNRWQWRNAGVEK